MGTISGCRHLKVNLKAKIYINVSSTTQRWPNKIIKIFLIEDFVNDTGGKPWAANISANFQKNLKRSQWNTLGLGGNWFMKRTRSKKSCDTVPLRFKKNRSILSEILIILLPTVPISYPYHCHIDQFKGTESRYFRFWFFSWISFPPAPEYSIRTD